MTSHRRTATLVGALFLIAMGASVLGGSIVDGIIGADDYLTSVADARYQVVIGVILEVINCAAVVGIAVLMFPILRRRNEAAALGYVGFRVIESTVLAIAAVVPLAMVKLSTEYAGAAVEDASGLESVGVALLGVREGLYGLMLTCFFCLGAFIFYYLLLRTELVPRFLSVWGLIGVVCVLALNVSDAFRDSTEMGVAMVLAIPIISNEIVLGIWLIARGFREQAVTSLMGRGGVAARASEG